MTFNDPISSAEYQMLPSVFAMRFMPKRLTQSIDWHGHLCFAAWLLELVQPQSIVELGVFRGDSLSTFAQASRELGISPNIMGVDTWAGDETTGKYSEEVYADLRDHFATNYPSVRLFRGFFDDALPTVPVASVDVLHIDGSHLYDDVKHDYETWLSRMSERGVILFHDVTVENGTFGTKRFWDEVRVQFPSFSFDHSNGLGVLLCGPNQPERLRRIAEDRAYCEVVKAVFELTGAKFFHLAKEKWWKQETDRLASYASHISSGLGQNIGQNAAAQIASAIAASTTRSFMRRLASAVLRKLHLR
jgi:predicted O-methyltransferase YrrM